jgi:putative component of toxin-antitoxin plasmid stabilization module
VFSIKRTDDFSAWLDGLKDRVTRQRLNARLSRALRGGDKSTQSADVAKATKLAAMLEE